MYFSSQHPLRPACRSRLLLALAASVALLAGCSRSDPNAVTQAVAKVNKDEITEQQVNQILERQRGLKPEQIEAASQRAVAALVDQEVVFQKARDLKLDREPRVVNAIEAARRELISRAYLERVADGATPPTSDEIRSYYEAKPALFKERRIYSLQELAVETTPEQRAGIEAQLKALKSTAELEAFVKEKQLRVRAERSTVPAENVPLPLLERLSGVKPGSGIVVPAATGVRIVLVNAIQEAPVTAEQARPAIEAFLLNERKRAAVEREMQSLRAAASVEYLGKFKGMAASAAGASAAPGASAAAQPSLPAVAAAASATMDEATANKGLSGLK